MSDIRSSVGSKAAAASSAAFEKPQTTVFVDVGARKIDANITRDGVAITALPIDLDALDDIITGRPQVRTKVVSQSIPAGTPVRVGSTVDLVLAQPSQVPIRIIEGVHVELRERTFDSIYSTTIAQNAELRRVLARTADPETLTPTDAQVVRSALNTMDISVTDEPGRDLNAGFIALKAGMTFGT